MSIKINTEVLFLNLSILLQYLHFLYFCSTFNEIPSHYISFSDGAYNSFWKKMWSNIKIKHGYYLWQQQIVVAKLFSFFCRSVNVVILVFWVFSFFSLVIEFNVDDGTLTLFHHIFIFHCTFSFRRKFRGLIWLVIG